MGRLAASRIHPTLSQITGRVIVELEHEGFENHDVAVRWQTRRRGAIDSRDLCIAGAHIWQCHGCGEMDEVCGGNRFDPRPAATAAIFATAISDGISRRVSAAVVVQSGEPEDVSLFATRTYSTKMCMLALRQISKCSV